MNPIKAFGGFCYEFIVGDDWRVAVAVVAALAITSGLAATAIPAWAAPTAGSTGASRRAATPHRCRRGRSPDLGPPVVKR